MVNRGATLEVTFSGGIEETATLCSTGAIEKRLGGPDDSRAKGQSSTECCSNRVCTESDPSLSSAERRINQWMDKAPAEIGGDRG